MATRYPLVLSQRVPFSVLFPGVASVIECELMLKFKLLQCGFLRGLLSHCTEKLTRDIVLIPENIVRPSTIREKRTFCLYDPGRITPYLILSDSEGVFSQGKIRRFVVAWYNFVTAFRDEHIARIAYPSLFEFVRSQVLCREKIPCTLDDQDIAQIVMLLVKETSLLYKGNRWVSNNADTAKTFGRWFTKD
ncbi:hypothetical protein AUJ77_02410 [Candidatus Nomurabacteria bacterium CG1_02_43_90]|uniref:Uncharacterized protein n=1 Tax=Candidatus Nomurabacteria bacterium CG1_02_43_90 TaxID=1805281 RepID=A0A1J4V8Q0_9BACT|nr:MAG: hypothetical protein AUJ77_02410 [Candidatus Nomurabacteria bacterium CG1_02_43_90]